MNLTLNSLYLLINRLVRLIKYLRSCHKKVPKFVTKDVGQAWAILKMNDGSTEITHKVSGTYDKHAFHVMIEKLNNSDHFILQNTTSFKFISKYNIHSFSIAIEKFEQTFEL